MSVVPAVSLKFTAGDGELGPLVACSSHAEAPFVAVVAFSLLRCHRKLES